MTSENRRSPLGGVAILQTSPLEYERDLEPLIRLSGLDTADIGWSPTTRGNRFWVGQGTTTIVPELPAFVISSGFSNCTGLVMIGERHDDRSRGVLVGHYDPGSYFESF